MMLLVFFLILVGLGVAAYFGHTADTRDPEYGLGLLLHPRTRN
jgi:hypothetical protein